MTWSTFFGMLAVVGVYLAIVFLIGLCIAQGMGTRKK